MSNKPVKPHFPSSFGKGLDRLSLAYFNPTKQLYIADFSDHNFDHIFIVPV